MVSVGLLVAAQTMLKAGFQARPEMLPSGGLHWEMTAPLSG